MSNIEVWPQEWTESEGQITVSAAIERSGEPRRSLWYRVPADQRSALTRSAAPFLAGVLFEAMHAGGRLTIHGDVSPSLLRNIEEFQSAWVMWRPELYRRVEIAADRVCETAPAESPGAVMTFSGGVDSCFTAWRHRMGRAGHQQCDLRAGVFVHGFDIRLNRQAEYDGALERSRRMLTSIGMECIPMATNFRELKGDWEDTHAAGLASCLMLLQGGYRQGLIASSFGYSYLVLPYGSNPLTDGMFSSAAFPVFHDGAGFHRLQKTREIAQWPEMAKDLRVCWAGEKLDRNCCRCQKCVSNILYFRLVGLPHLECFERDISNREMIWMRYPTVDEIKSMQRIIKIATDTSLTDSWVRALKISVFLNQLRMAAPSPIRALWRHLRAAGRAVRPTRAKAGVR